jgi:AcrR family transcriptional regulator
MARPNQSERRRGELIAVLAAVFVEFGYRRTTTATLAERCGVQETILYRLWPDKRAMFAAAIEFVAEHSKEVWAGALANRPTAKTAAETVLDYESDHLGEFGLYRILFAGLSETDDPTIRNALRAAYRSLHAFILDRAEEHRGERKGRKGPPAELVAWALVGLGTAASLGRELDLLPKRERAELLATIGRVLLG